MNQLKSLFLPLRDILLILIGAIVFNAIGLANNFPFVYPDSGSYIFHGSSLEVPWGRPIFYSLFFKVASFRDTPFLAVFFQGLMLSFLCFLIFKYLCTHRLWRYFFIGTVFLTTMLTGVSFTVSRIMPDIFTPILLLGMAVIFFVKDLKTINFILVGGIMILSLSVHNSHVLIWFGLLFLYSINYLYRSWKQKNNLIPINRLGSLWGMGIASVLLVCSVHYQLGGGFKLSKGSHVFIMRQLIDFGIVEKYLKRNCAEKDYKLCNYQDKLDGNFIWDYKNSPFRTLGGWEENEEEYKTIIYESLSQGRYFKMFIGGAIENTFKQFFSFHLDDFDPEKKGSAPYGAIEKHYQTQIHEYEMAYQTRNKLENIIRDYNSYQHLTIYASLLFIVLLFFATKLWKSLALELRWFIVFIFLAMWANAFVCSSLSAVVTRYQYRVTWILPMLVVLVMTSKGFWPMVKEELRKA